MAVMTSPFEITPTPRLVVVLVPSPSRLFGAIRADKMRVGFVTTPALVVVVSLSIVVVILFIARNVAPMTHAEIRGTETGWSMHHSRLAIGEIDHLAKFGAIPVIGIVAALITVCVQLPNVTATIIAAKVKIAANRRVPVENFLA